MRSEPIVRALHEAHPGATSKALARAGSYEKLWSRVRGTRVLDLACGDRPMPGAIGIDLVRERGIAVQGRVQQLPFADGAFDAALCHLAFMLFDDIEQVVAELHRVLAPGATFHALLGGGPVADGEDAFHAFVRAMPKAEAMGDPRSKREAGWRELFAGWSEPRFERWELDLTGSFEDVWLFLGASYSLRDAERVRRDVRAAFPVDPVPCRVACFYATVTR
ncbi:MAG: class I SAM-dependent methyltransferase [Deltaproteobacteria bacterium]|nr:class I SAM-dependent methyltransferase [Deltaproteobacteria bacterium]